MAATPHRPAPAAPQRKVGDVYAWLKKQVMLSHLQPGQPLVELDIAQQMNCSQGTVREALMRLQEEGLILRQGYRGTVVSPVSATEAQVVLKLREQLEAEGVRLSVPRLEAGHTELLSALVQRMEASAEAGDEYGLFELDQQFHATLFGLAGMPTLVPVLVRCSQYNHRNKIALDTAPRSLAETARRHWRIVEALKTGNADEVERVLRHHIASVTGDETEGAEPRPALAPELQQLLAATPPEIAQLPDITTLPLDAARVQFDFVNQRWNRIRRSDFQIQRFAIPAPPRPGRVAGQGIAALRIRHRLAHDASHGTLLHLHGGGWVFGHNGTHLGAMARLAQGTGCTVVGIDYGLAPEAPFPQGLNDCAWAWRWLRSQGADGAVAAPWFVAGDSAGANLALAMMIDLRNAGEPLPDAALLFYGVYAADHGTPSHRRCGSGEFGLSSAKMAWYRAHYLAGGQGSADDPRVSPLHARLHGLPPLLVTGAELDPLFDDSALLAKRLADTDTPFEFRRYAGMNHGFMQMAGVLPQAQRAFDDAAAFLHARLRAASLSPTGDTP